MDKFLLELKAFEAVKNASSRGLAAGIRMHSK
jgi:hypothetical protein